MIDNTDRLRHLLLFPDEDTFYFLQIFKRRKDNPDMEQDMIVLENFCIKSIDHFDKLVPKIINRCKVENARAYLRLNRRSYKKTALRALRLTAEHIEAGQYRSVRKAFDSAAGSNHSDPDKTWIVDIDYKDLDGDRDTAINFIIDWVQILIAETDRDDTIYTVPTKNGLHLICRPFNLQKFKSVCSWVDVHKDNPTILYAN